MIWRVSPEMKETVEDVSLVTCCSFDSAYVISVKGVEGTARVRCSYIW